MSFWSHDAARAFAPASLIRSVIAAVRSGDARGRSRCCRWWTPSAGRRRRHAARHRRPGNARASCRHRRAFVPGHLRRAHRTAAERGDAATDDAGLVEAIGITVGSVPGDRAAFKITTPGRPRAGAPADGRRRIRSWPRLRPAAADLRSRHRHRCPSDRAGPRLLAGRAAVPGGRRVFGPLRRRRGRACTVRRAAGRRRSRRSGGRLRDRRSTVGGRLRGHPAHRGGDPGAGGRVTGW